MCQVDEDNILLQGKKSIPGASARDCMKCGEKAVIIARIKDAFCRSCFLTYFSHRFRATFGKARIIRDGDKVLLAFSGGQCSSAMVDLVRRGLDQSTHKKLRFVPALIFIDEGAVTGQTEAERSSTCLQIGDMMFATGFKWYIAALEEVLDIPPENSSAQSTSLNSCEASYFHENQDQSTELSGRLDRICLNTDQTQKLIDLLASTTSLTAKQDLVNNLRTRLLVHKARELGYSKLAVGVSGTRLSAGILGNLAKGRGAAIPVAMAFADDRHEGVAILRPMREFTSKEVCMYNALFNVDSLFQSTLATKAGDYASIDTLTESFVNSLQTNFPSTVSTVFRTGEKMCVAEPNEAGLVTRCSMCMSALDTAVGKSSAYSATKFSAQMSRMALVDSPNCSSETCSDSAMDQCCGQGDGSCHSSQQIRVSPEGLNAILCYGCQVTIRDVKDVNLLPSHILEEAAIINRRSRMRDEIQDFLLPEDS